MNQQKQQFIDSCPVSYETAQSLEIYEKMLVLWSQKFNLVAPSTLPHIWTRHFLDSAQIYPLLPLNIFTVADMGSGAGFPGLVLAIMAKEAKRSLMLYLIESTGKKADFLQAVIDELKLDVTVKRDRIENIRDLKVDIVTARALKPLPELLVYANYLLHKNTICIFPKGQAVAEELTQAAKYWTFKADTHPSRSDDSGSILVLSNLRYKSRR